MFGMSLKEKAVKGLKKLAGLHSVMVYSRGEDGQLINCIGHYGLHIADKGLILSNDADNVACESGIPVFIAPGVQEKDGMFFQQYANGWEVKYFPKDDTYILQIPDYSTKEEFVAILKGGRSI